MWKPHFNSAVLYWDSTCWVILSLCIFSIFINGAALMFLSLSYRIRHNSSASALTEQVKPGRGNQTLIICPWISTLHHRLLCKRFVFDEVTLIYNLHHHYCASYTYPGRIHIQHVHLLHDETTCFPLHAEAVSVWWAQSRLRAGGREEDSSTAKHQNGVDRRATVQNIVINNV